MCIECDSYIVGDSVLPDIFWAPCKKGTFGPSLKIDSLMEMQKFDQEINQKFEIWSKFYEEHARQTQPLRIPSQPFKYRYRQSEV